MYLAKVTKILGFMNKTRQIYNLNLLWQSKNIMKNLKMSPAMEAIYGTYWNLHSLPPYLSLCLGESRFLKKCCFGRGDN